MYVCYKLSEVSLSHGFFSPKSTEVYILIGCFFLCVCVCVCVCVFCFGCFFVCVCVFCLKRTFYWFLLSAFVAHMSFLLVSVSLVP